MEKMVKNKLVIIGASGHGKVIADIALLNGYTDIVFLDDDASLETCAGFPVIGDIASISNYKESEFIIAIGDSEVRRQLHHFLKGYCLATLIHPNATISRRVVLGRGTVIMAGAVINSDVTVGEGCIINTGATVDHDCQIGDYCHISIGAHLAGTVSITNNVWIGAGSTIINNIKIDSPCMIGAGAVVISDISESGTYLGVPAKLLKEKK